MPSKPRFVSRFLAKPRVRAVAQTFGFLPKLPWLYIDQQITPEISDSICVINGWFAWELEKPQPSLKLNNADAAWLPIQRPDVQRNLPAYSTQGFQIVLEIERFLTPAISSGEPLTLQLAMGDKTAEWRVNAAAIQDAAAAEDRRNAKHEWIKDRLACPACPNGSGRLDFSGPAIQCRTCGEKFVDLGNVFDFLPEHLRLQFHIDQTHDISAHLYDEVAKGLIENARSAGGKVLNCGAGLCRRVDETVICLEVAPFPTADVLGVNQKLPFKNDVFDSVLSLNVLEHVTDPFTCAAELVRVLKPGGTLYCCIPFLQPEHGYPHHYFNATRSGLRQLFAKDLELLEHSVPGSGEPFWTLHWFLSRYADQLPWREKEKFLNLRIADVIEKPAGSFLSAPWVRNLPDEGKWMLASTTAAIFRKPS